MMFSCSSSTSTLFKFRNILQKYIGTGTLSRDSLVQNCSKVEARVL